MNIVPAAGGVFGAVLFACLVSYVVDCLSDNIRGAWAIPGRVAAMFMIAGIVGLAAYGVGRGVWCIASMIWTGGP